MFSERILNFKTTSIDPLFPGVAFKCRWLDNLKAYRASNMTERQYLEFAAHDLLATARNTQMTGNGQIVGSDFRQKILNHLPDNSTSLSVANDFLQAVRERIFDEVPAMRLLGENANVSMLIDVYKHYGTTNIYGANDPTQHEMRNATIHFSNVMEAYSNRLASNISSSRAEASQVFATGTNAISRFKDFCDNRVISKIEAAVEKLEDIVSPAVALSAFR
jgi:hypothetical protein